MPSADVVKKSRGLPLRAKMTLMFIGVIVLPLTITLVVSMRISAQRAERELRQTNSHALAEARDVLDEFRERAGVMAELLANSESVKERLRSMRRFDFSESGHEVWNMAQVEVFDRQGRLLARAEIKGVDAAVYHTPEGHEIIRKTLKLELGPEYSGTETGFALKTGMPVLDYATLEVIGAVIVTLPFNMAMIEDLQARVGASVSIFWDAGKKAAGSIAALALETPPSWKDILAKAQSGRPAGDSETIMRNGRPHAAAYAPLLDRRGNPAGVIETSMDYQRVLAGERDSMRLLVVSAAASLALAIVLGFFTAMRFTRPIHRLLRAIRELSGGELGRRLEADRGDEFGELAAEFNEMAGRLEQERRFLAASEEKYRTLFENSIEGIFRSTLSGRLLSVNPALAHMFGYENPEAFVRAIDDIGRELYVDREERRKYVERLLRDGYVMDEELMLKRRDGTEIWVSERARLAPGEPDCIEGTLVDVTERRRAMTMERAKIEAEAANRAKSEFLAAMSHEIRTPLNVIAGMVEAALYEDQPEKRRERLETCQDAASHLLDLINDVLDFSRIEAGKFDLECEDIDLWATLDRVSRTMRGQAESKGLAFDLVVAEDVPRFLYADAARLRQILINLSGNAIKFTERGRVRLSVSRQNGEMADGMFRLAFAVTDTGIGIGKDKLHAVFDQYAQADASIPRLFGGSGLGLAISLRLVQLMDGDITAASEEGKGSVFTFVAPFKPGDAGRAMAGEETGRMLDEPGRPLRVLVVEDNPANFQVARLHLERLGHEATLAQNGLEALEALRRSRFNLVLMDLEMPEMGGLEAVRAIRSGRAGVLDPDLPIVVMTAHAMAETRKRCLASGMDGFLTKPVNLKRLTAVIARAMSDSKDCTISRDAPLCDDRTPILDERAARKELGVSPDDFPMIMDAALGEIERRAKLMDTAIRAGDLKDAVMHAHTVKSSAATIGAYRLSRASLKLEKAAANRDAGEIARCFAVFQRERGDLLQCVQKV